MSDTPLLDDDPSVSDDEIVWRRVPPQLAPATASGARRCSSGAFSDSSDSAMSVDLASLARDPELTRHGYEGFGVVAIRVGDLRNIGFGVRRDPRCREQRSRTRDGQQEGKEPKASDPEDRIMGP